MKKTRKIGINGISVERLFGLYDYEIPGNEEIKKIERILILYGDNGSGKTTILRLIFHLLACERRQNHKTFVARTKFKRLSIRFNNGYEIIAFRKGKELLGSFAMTLLKGGDKITSVEFLADSDNFIKTGGSNDKDIGNFLETIGELNLTLYLLGDDRTVKVTSPRRLRRSMYKTRIVNEGVYVGGHRSYLSLGEEHELDPEQISIRLVEESLRRLRNWIRNHIMRGSTRGETNVNVIFFDIIDKIASEKKRGPRKKATRREYLIERIKRIEKRNKDFSKYRLSPSFNGQKLLNAID